MKKMKKVALLALLIPALPALAQQQTNEVVVSISELKSARIEKAGTAEETAAPAKPVKLVQPEQEAEPRQKSIPIKEGETEAVPVQAPAREEKKTGKRL